MTTNKKRIAIVGGGMSGLTSIKACLEEGLEPVCFEASDNIGGLWRYRNDDIEGRSSVTKSTVINTSKEVSAFSDFPPPKEFPNYMHNRHMCRYFELYADHFGLRAYIRFHHKVNAVNRAVNYASTGRWSIFVTYQDPRSDEATTSEEIFDGVLICTGHHVIPDIPKFEGLSSFKGRVVHTHGYKVPDEFVDKKVMVVGTGNSGSDAAVELSGVAEQVYLSTRRGFWMINRVGPKGYPIDMTFATRFNIFWVPDWVRTRALEKMALGMLDYELYGIKASHAVTAQHPTVSDALPNRIICGTVVVKGPIRRFVPEGVIFQDEEDKGPVPLDGVVMATGYKPGYTYLEPGLAKIDSNTCELYMYVFPPHLRHSTLAFIGNAQPIGPIFPLSEIQARWYVQVFKGNVKLPSKEAMLKDIAKRAKYNSENYISGSRHVTEVIGIVYLDQVAAMIGARPNLFSMFFFDHSLFRKVFFGALVSYQFRLRGPHRWSGARNAIMTYESRVKTAFQTNTPALKMSNQISTRRPGRKIFFVVAVFIGFNLFRLVKKRILHNSIVSC